MKRNVRLTFSAVMSALAVVIALMAYFPYLTYALPAMAGLCVMAVLIETDNKWALLTYISSAVLLFFLGEIESKILYISFFGYYPILKAIIEKLRKPIIEWIIKEVVFNAIIIAVYSLFSGFLGMESGDFGILGQYGAIILLVGANVVFVLYDICLSRMAVYYLYRIHPKIQRAFKF